MTENEILDALRVAMGCEGEDVIGAYTTNELSELTNRGDKAVRNGIKRLLHLGAAEVVYVQRQRIDGQWQRVPAYRLKG